jgi:hypothetical protein
MLIVFIYDSHLSLSEWFWLKFNNFGLEFMEKVVIIHNGSHLIEMSGLYWMSCRSADVWERMKGKDNPIKRWKWWEQLTLSDAIISCDAQGIEIIDAAKYPL